MTARDTRLACEAWRLGEAVVRGAGLRSYFGSSGSSGSSSSSSSSSSS
jgi:hypothetical protein